MANIAHKGGLPELVSEVGFSNVKYFEGSVGTTAVTLSISPPAKRLILRNTSSSVNLFINITGDTAETTTGFLPGDNIKIAPQGVFTMDFDSLSSLSLVSQGSVVVEGLLGFKGM